MSIVRKALDYFERGCRRCRERREKLLALMPERARRQLGAKRAGKALPLAETLPSESHDG